MGSIVKKEALGCEPKGENQIVVSDTNIAFSAKKNLTPFANELLKAGVCAVPATMPSKRPALAEWTKYQKQLPSLGEHSFNGAIGIITGKISGNLFVLDVDIKYDLTGNLLDMLQEALGDELYGRIQKVAYIQTTINKGLHIFLRCEAIEGNQKLASRYASPEELSKSPHEKQKVLIETRGEAGFIVLAPTEGYQAISGNPSEVGFISIEDKESLFEACRSLNEVFEEVKPPNSKKFNTELNGLPPWEDFNQKADVPALSQLHGFTYVKTVGKNQHYCRAGKTGETSATWNEEKNLFYVFSTSTVLEANKAYTPSALFTYLECAGDFSEAAKRLRSLGYGERSKLKEPSTVSKPIGDWRALQITTEPPEETPLISIGEAPVATAGNYSLIIGKKKSRKTLFITWFISQYKGDQSQDVLLFDTEQGTRHVWKVMDRIRRLTGHAIGTFYLRGKSPAERREFIETVVREYPTRPKMILIDGTRDLLSNINDPDQVSELLTWLEKLTLDNGLHVVNVLHQNKTDNNARGHLGSELLNKSEVTIDLERDEKADCTIVKCESSRDIHFESFAFRHDENGLPEIVGMPTKKGDVITKDETMLRLQYVFDGEVLKRGELITGIRQHFVLSRDKADQLLLKCVRDGFIAKNGRDRSPNTVYKLL